MIKQIKIIKMTIKMKKKNKVKIIISIVLISVALLTTLLVTLSINTTSYSMAINRPNQIIIYHNNSATNKVYEPSVKEFSQLYSLFNKSFEQKILPAILSGELNNDVKVKQSAGEIKPGNVCIALMYNVPQVLKLEKDLYKDTNGENYWYQSLIFNVVNKDNYQYHSIAIVPPNDSTEFISNFNYNLYYEIYGNFNQLYNYALELFN